jgi:hypothetical protein
VCMLLGLLVRGQGRRLTSAIFGDSVWSKKPIFAVGHGGAWLRRGARFPSGPTQNGQPEPAACRASLTGARRCHASNRAPSPVVATRLLHHGSWLPLLHCGGYSSTRTHPAHAIDPPPPATCYHLTALGISSENTNEGR